MFERKEYRKMKKTECPICGKLITNNNIEKHIKSHETHPEYQAKQSNGIHVYHLDHTDLFCKFCGKECKNLNSLRNHERLCTQNPNRQIIKTIYREGFNNPGRTAWNKGLNKYNNESVANQAKSLKEHYTITDGTFKGKRHTNESRIKISLANAGNTKGNRSKKGYYKGIYCGSSYELVYVIYNLDHNISFKRCDKYYEYEYKGLTHLYFPDFELSDGTIIEIKGYHTDIVDIKSESVKDRPIKVLYKKDLLEYFKYVCSAYDVKESEIYTLYDKLY